MAKKSAAKDMTPVTLITTDILTPYAKGEVFTVPAYVADLLLSDDREDADGNPVPVKVEKFEASKSEHKNALVAQRGKDGDEVVETPATGSPVSQERQDAANAAADKARPVAEANAVTQSGEQDQARIEKTQK